MSEIRTFFRHCPNCGRRFEIRVAKTQPPVDDSYSSEMASTDIDTVSAKALDPLVLDGANQPLIVKDNELSTTYICKHCGHQWTEVRDNIDVEPTPEGYTGD